MLYAALSQSGEVAPLRYRADTATAAATPLFGPMAAWYVNDILAAAPAPPGMLPAEVKRSRPLAFKTGTSYGFRDAWAIGYDREVTIAVWAGRPTVPQCRPQRPRHSRTRPVQDRRSTRPIGRQANAEPPTGALLVSRRDLPEALRHLDPGPFDWTASAMPAARKSSTRRTEQRSPGMAGKSARSRRRPRSLALAGRRPAIGGGQKRRTLYWHPGGLGFAQLTVIDADGRSSRATVRLTRR